MSEEIKKCYDSIKHKLITRLKHVKCIEAHEYIAFSGDFKNPELAIYINKVVKDLNSYLCANIDDEVYFYEYDYKNRDEFENAIVEYIEPLVNRTIKYVTYKKKHKYIKFSRYYNNGNNEWVLIDEEIADSKIIKLFIFKNSVKEIIKEYGVRI